MYNVYIHCTLTFPKIIDVLSLLTGSFTLLNINKEFKIIKKKRKGTFITC